MKQTTGVFVNLIAYANRRRQVHNPYQTAAELAAAEAAAEAAGAAKKAAAVAAAAAAPPKRSRRQAAKKVQQPTAPETAVRNLRARTQRAESVQPATPAKAGPKR